MNKRCLTVNSISPSSFEFPVNLTLRQYSRLLKTMLDEISHRNTFTAGTLLNTFDLFYRWIGFHPNLTYREAQYLAISSVILAKENMGEKFDFEKVAKKYRLNPEVLEMFIDEVEADFCGLTYLPVVSYGNSVASFMALVQNTLFNGPSYMNGRVLVDELTTENPELAQYKIKEIYLPFENTENDIYTYQGFVFHHSSNE